MSRFRHVILIAVLLIALQSLCQGQSSLEIPARQHAAKSSSVVPIEKAWDGLVVTHGPDGMQQWNCKIAKGGEYYIHFQYASGEKRPVQLFVNDKRQNGLFLKSETGGFFVRHLEWDSIGPLILLPGENAIRIQAEGLSPHLAGLVISKTSKHPNDKVFAKLFSKISMEKAPKIDLVGPINENTAATREKLRRLMPDTDELLFIRRYTLQSSHYYTDFIDGCRHFGGNLCALSLKDGTTRKLAPQLAHGIFGRFDLSFDAKKVVFGWKENSDVGFRIWEVGIDGKGLRQITFPPADEAARINKYKLDMGPKWLYKHHTDDMHPCYLPDGGICFVSTRCEYGILCDGPDKLTTSVIYRMDGDGKNMEKLSNNSVSESAPTVMNDGRILYTRWEYVDNGSVTNKGLWVLRPDGTGSEEIYGMDIAFPSVFNVGRAVPGNDNTYFVAIGAPHMPLGVGTLMLIDTRLDRRSGECVTYITPEVDTQHQSFWDNIPGGATKPIPPEMQKGRDGRGNTDKGPLYMDPYPLSTSQFLVSFNPRDRWNVENAYGLYLIDDKGTKDLLLKDPETSLWNPYPVRPRPLPPVVRGGIDEKLAKKNLARVVVMDVYRGLDNVPRGVIKYIRVNEHVPRPWASRRFWGGDVYDQQHSVISDKTHLGLKIQHGIVPVEEDGSAHFLVEADKNIFFQALDKDYIEVQRERTFVNFRPGETRSCVGCHEQANDVARTTRAKMVAAIKRAPSIPGPQPGEKTGARPLDYAVDVQPVLDKHCVSCHGAEKPDGKLNLTGNLTNLFNTSYENIINRKLIPIIGENHPKSGNNHYLPPYSLGTYASELWKFMGKDHYNVALTPEERIRLTTWIDSNGQYYGSYYGRKNLQYKDHPNFRPVLTFAQSHANTPPLPEDQR